MSWNPYPPPPPSKSRRNQNVVLVAALAVIVLCGGVLVGVLLTRSGDDTKNAAGSGTPTRTTSTSAAARDVQSSDVASTPTQDFASIYATAQSGVVRIEVVGCSDSGVGTGFLISPTLVATVQHVVAQAAVVSLVDGGQRTTGRVIGADPATDLALVRADRPLSGHRFTFAVAPARVGDRVAAIGFPIGGPIALTQGGISGLDRTVTVDGTTRSGLIQTDVAINPGNSGGPLLATDGTVVGLVDAKNTEASGIGYAVPAGQAQPRMASWTQSPQTQPGATCDTPTGPDQPADLAIPGLTADASEGITATFKQYFDGINTAQYRSAWLALSPRKRGSSLAPFAHGWSTSFDTDIAVLAANQLNDTTARVALRSPACRTGVSAPGAARRARAGTWSTR